MPSPKLLSSPRSSSSTIATLCDGPSSGQSIFMHTHSNRMLPSMPNSSQNENAKIAATSLPNGPRLGGGTGREASATGVTRQRVGTHPPLVGGTVLVQHAFCHLPHVLRHRRVGGGVGQGETHFPELAALQQAKRMALGQ